MPSRTPFTVRASTTRAAVAATTTTTETKGIATTTTTQVLIASASQTTQSWLLSALRKTTRRRPLAASKTYSKRSVCGIWRATILPSSATNCGEHSKTLQTHDLLTTKKARRKSMKAIVTSKNPTRR
jgi:hypothetical protein